MNSSIVECHVYIVAYRCWNVFLQGLEIEHCGGDIYEDISTLAPGPDAVWEVESPDQEWERTLDHCQNVDLQDCKKFKGSNILSLHVTQTLHKPFIYFNTCHVFNSFVQEMFCYCLFIHCNVLWSVCVMWIWIYGY